jgi:membrane protease YdiL (CAAX protease family)
MNAHFDKLFGPVPDLPSPRGLDADRRAGWALWTCAIALVLLVFHAGLDFEAWVPGWQGSPSRSFPGRSDWLVAGFVYYLLVPLAVVLFVFRESPSRYGLRIHITRRTAILYVVAFAILIPALFWASGDGAFLARYPMVRGLDDDFAMLLLWEASRGLRFVALEFFFRGFLLFSLEERMGYNAIAVAALPYGLLHYGKPFPEALGAIVAGAVLGLFALRTRSIAGGALVHIVVATSMDLLALWRMGAFGG